MEPELFSSAEMESAVTDKAALEFQPLAARLRPLTLDEMSGQSHILGEGKLLRRMIEADRISSIILYGPPGTGKTSLAHVIANSTSARFVRLSGIESNVAEMRKVISTAIEHLEKVQRKTILFVDEIHRFSKNQQDILLPEVESGRVRFVGATTHNPFFYVNSPLVSRSQIFQLEPLKENEIIQLLQRALRSEEKGLGKYRIHADEEALTHLAKISDGDARRALNALEIGILSTQQRNSAHPEEVIHFTLAAAEESIQKKAVVYDANDDQHYDTASAFIKSIRGSDPDAAIYWLAKMLHAGEDPRFIARRLVIAASEDIGMADPRALLIAVATQQAVEFVGLPEARINLAQAVVHLATAPKSNRAYAALSAALADIEKGRTLAVPVHLRDSHYGGAKQLGHGEDYRYSHDYEGAYVPQAYLDEGRCYYEPSDQGDERQVRERLSHWRALFQQSQREGAGKDK